MKFAGNRRGLLAVSGLIILFLAMLAFYSAQNSEAQDQIQPFQSKLLREAPLQECLLTSQRYNVKNAIEKSPFCDLQSGAAEWICYDGSSDQIRDITKQGFLYNPACYNSNNIDHSFKYKGEIDKSLLLFVENLEMEISESESYIKETCDRNGYKQDCEAEPLEVYLSIDSPGGDAEAAIDIARVMSKRKWTVGVREQCFSSCVFLVAAAAERLILGKIGIHRIFPVGSSAENRTTLDQQLEEITRDAKTLLRENGVNPSLVDDMMTVPSTQIRTLTAVELDQYGLGRNNGAQIDLQRASIERKCGEAFSRKLILAEALTETCGGNEVGGDYERYLSCKNAGLKELGFPDKICPKDGPQFICDFDKTTYNYESSFEPCD